MDFIPKECFMCKRIIDNLSKFITIPANNKHIYFHRFCYFNYRTEFLK